MHGLLGEWRNLLELTNNTVSTTNNLLKYHQILTAVFTCVLHCFNFTFRFIHEKWYQSSHDSHEIQLITGFVRELTDDATFGRTLVFISLVFISLILIISCWFFPTKFVIGGWLFGFTLLSWRSRTFSGFLWLRNGLLRYTSFLFGLIYSFLVSTERSQTCIGFPTYSTFMCEFNMGFFLATLKQAQMPSFLSSWLEVKWWAKITFA